jgi:hypothetical protein
METVANRSLTKVLPFFLPAALLAAAWMGVNLAFPGLAPTGIPNDVVRVAINVVILAGLWGGLRRTDFGRRARRIAWLAVAVSLTLWSVLVRHLAIAGVFQPVPNPVHALPALPVAIFLPLLVLLPVLLRSRRVGAILDATPRSWLIGLQLYRVLGSTFLVNWIHGAIPGAFAWPAGIGDMLVGLFALPVAMRVGSLTSEGRRAGIWWNVMGLTDLAVAITMGVLTSPGPLQVLAIHRAVSQIGVFPSVMIPALAVPSSIILHALSLRQLRRAGRIEAGAVERQQRHFMCPFAAAV